MTARKRWTSVIGVALVLVAAVVGDLMMCRGTSNGPGSSKASNASRPSSGIIGHGPINAERPDTPHNKNLGTMRLEGQVIDEQDRPVGGATVAMYYPPDISTKTEADGSFVFEGLAAQGYSVLAVKGSLVGDASVRVRETSEPLIIRVHGGPTVVIRVVDADGGAPIAAAHLRTWGHSSETDHDGVARVLGVWASNPHFDITADGYEPATLGVHPSDDVASVTNKTVELHRGASVSGSVVGPNGKPLADAEVNVQSVEAGWSGTAKTDAKGAWHFDALGAGKHLFSATSETYGAAPDLPIELDGKSARTGIVVHVDYGGQLVGTVVDVENNPVRDARVILDWEDPQGPFGSYDTTSDANGKFSFLGTPFNTYRVWARVGKAASPRTTVNLTKDQRVEVRVVVEDSGISGTVVDSKGNPVPEIAVGASSAHSWNGPSAGDTTDRHGAFDLGGVPPGEYTVRGRGGDGLETDTVTTKTGAPPIKLVVKEPSSITGRVILDGKPVAYYGIALTDHPEYSWGQHPTPNRSADGRFKQDRISPGTWTLIVSGPGFAQKQVKDIHVPERQNIDIGDIVLEHGITIRGHVFDAAGSPVAGASVAVHRLISYDNADDPLNQIAQGVFHATSSAAGEYQIIGITPSDSDDDQNRIFASHPTLGVSAEHNLPTHDGVLDLRLTAAGGIDGVVQGGGGLVTATRSGADTSQKDAFTDADGKFHFDQLLPGDYVVALSGDFSRVGPRPAKVTVVANKRASAIIKVSAVKILLAIRAEQGECKSVSLRPADATPKDEGAVAFQTCEAGEGQIADVPPGQYQVCADKACVPYQVNEQPARQEIRVPAKR